MNLTRNRSSCNCFSSANHMSNNRSRRKRSVASVTPLALFVFLFQSYEGASFLSEKQKQHPRTHTRRNFRHIEDTEVVPTAPTDSVTFFNIATLSPGVAADVMPSWLSQERGHLANENLSSLKEAMSKAELSESEMSTVISAIEESSKGDPNKIAGAAELCLIMVNTMEMGVSALVAAAFHYSACLNARKQSSMSHSSFWERYVSVEEGPGILSYGASAVLIARDAAKLKRAETMATSIVQSLGTRPDQHNSENLLNLFLAEAQDWRALAIRSAACLYRLRGIIQSWGDDLSTAKLTLDEIRVPREALYIYAPLASRLGMHRLKNELEGAAFRLLYPRQYKKVTSLSEMPMNGKVGSEVTVGEGLQNVLEDVTDRVTQVLKEDRALSGHIDEVNVTARVKEPFSLWRKMLRLRAKSILDVPDAIALRVVFNAKKLARGEDSKVTEARERALCYYTQKVCTDHWSPLADNPRFKDYIQHPKSNGYQSLHYTAGKQWGNKNCPFEIQVRSGQMHRVAEYGLAAHWDYKRKNHGPSVGCVETNDTDGFKIDSGTDAYLKAVEEWHWQQTSQHNPFTRNVSKSEPTTDEEEYQTSEVRAQRVQDRSRHLAPYIKALSDVQTALSRQNVFVFLSSSSSLEGKLLALPAGACVLDALREGERMFGVNTVRHKGAVHNGVFSNVTKRLSNGDVVMVSVPSVGLV